ncbi:MAG TPA: outer membrane lipoprotein carrier protein LolA [Pyrinomonadaceae bacterium]
MKRFSPLAFLVVGIIAAFIVVTPTPAKGQSAGLVSSVLNRLEKNRANLKSLRAGINMEKYNSQLGTKDNSTGVVLYLPGAGRNASVRLEWKSPQHEILSVQNGKYVLFRPRLGVVYTGSSAKAPKSAGGIMDMMYMSRQQLEAKFQPLQDVREETLWGGVSTIHLTLVPKGNAGYKYAEVWIDAGGMPVQSKIVEKNDDATTMRLVSIEKNPKISSDDIPVKYDSNVKVIKS